MTPYVTPEAIKDAVLHRADVLSDGHPGRGHDEGRPLFDPWQAYPVPPFPTDVLPPTLKAFVDFQSRSIGADRGAIAMTVLAACSGALDHRFALKMKVHGDWWANPRLWVLLVGAPSTKKTPILATCLKPVRTAEREAERQHQLELARHKAAKDLGEDLAPPKPAVRYLANDITPEKLGELLSRQDRGLLVEHDELSGWIGAMDKYNGGSKGSYADRAFWLTAYNGVPMHIDRIARGSTYIENCSVSLIGGIQPKRLAELGNLTSDGLLQRFLPVLMNPAQLPEDIPEDGVVEAYGGLLGQLVALKSCKLTMAREALLAAKEFQTFVHDIEQADGLGEGFCTFVGKLPGVLGSLALILHLASDPENAIYTPVAEGTVEAAARILREFVIPHAVALYQQTSDAGDWDRLRSLASYVLTSGKDRFTPSDFTTNIRELRGLGVWDVAQKISPLVAGGWLTEDDSAGPARAWRVTPGLRQRFAERRTTEVARKAETLATLESLRRGATSGAKGVQNNRRASNK